VSKAISKKQSVKNNLELGKAEFKKALPAHVSIDKFIRVVTTAIINNDYLMEKASMPSIMGAAIKAAQDGLMPDGREAAIVPFKGNAQYMPMIAGILKKVRNSGELSSITSQTIHEKDEFEFYVDEKGEHLMHKPNMLEDRGEMRGAYALATTKDGAAYIEVMTMDELNAVRKQSSSKNGPWTGPFKNEMYRKTVLKRLAKRLPMSTDLEHTMRADDDMMDFNKPPAVEPEIVTPVDPEPVTKDLNKPTNLEAMVVEQTEVQNHAPGSNSEVPI